MHITLELYKTSIGNNRTDSKIIELIHNIDLAVIDNLKNYSEMKDFH